MFFKKRKEQDSLLRARTKALREAENKVEELTELQRRDSHNNYILLQENRKLVELLANIHKLSLTYLIGHEKVTLEKIKELTRGY